MHKLVYATSNDPAEAESVRSAQVTDIAIGFGLKLMEAACAGEPWPAEPHRLQADSRQFASKNVASCPFWTLYGQRGTDPRVAQLGAYEFAMHYQQKLAAHPLTVEVDDKEGLEPRFQACLTKQGREKLQGAVVLHWRQDVAEPTPAKNN